MNFINMAARQRRRGNASYPPSGGGGDTTPPEITLFTVETGLITIEMTEGGTVYMERNTDATPLAGSVIKAGADLTFAGIIEGDNGLSIDDAAWSPGTYQLHFVGEDAALNLAPFGTVIEYTKPAPVTRPQYVGGKVVAFSGTTSNPSAISLTDLTGGIGSAPLEGDVVYVGYSVGSTGNIDQTMVTADYVELADITASDSNDANLSVFRKVMGATPDTDVQVGPTTSANNAGAVLIQVFRGVDTVTPEDVAVVTATGIDGGRPTPGAITPTTAEAVVVVFGCYSSLALGTVFTSSDLTDFITISSADTNDTTIGGGYFDWTSGTFTPVQWGGGSTDVADSWAAVTIAMRPA